METAGDDLGGLKEQPNHVQKEGGGKTLGAQRAEKGKPKKKGRSAYSKMGPSGPTKVKAVADERSSVLALREGGVSEKAEGGACNQGIKAQRQRRTLRWSGRSTWGGRMTGAERSLVAKITRKRGLKGGKLDAHNSDEVRSLDPTQLKPKADPKENESCGEEKILRLRGPEEVTVKTGGGWSNFYCTTGSLIEGKKAMWHPSRLSSRRKRQYHSNPRGWARNLVRRKEDLLSHGRMGLIGGNLSLGGEGS